MRSFRHAKAEITRQVADFITGLNYEDLGSDLVQRAKLSILDGLAVAVAGSVRPGSGIVRDYASGFSSSGPQGTVIGSKLKIPPRFAALCNGTSMHADDWDDVYHAADDRHLGFHSTAAVLPAILASAETSRISGRELLVAYLAGIEVGCKIFDATDPSHVLEGLHSLGTCGPIGAAAGVAKICGLSREQVLTSLGIAASHSGGLRENFGTHMKSYHAGRAAECGLLSVELCQRGLTAAANILEAKRGFFRALGGTGSLDRFDGRLGNPWSIVDRGFNLKPWPSGGLSHAAITKMLELVEQADLQAGSVKEIRIETSQSVYNTLLQHSPESALEARFSLEFCVAAPVVAGTLDASHFSDEFVRRPDVRQMMGKVRYNTFSQEKAREIDASLTTALIDVELTTGETIWTRADYGKGSPQLPQTFDDIAAKMETAAGLAGRPPASCRPVIEIVGDLERLDDVRSLMERLKW
ncbi:MAG: MmgE/PrpD family protein [Rhizobiaceae bacterium]